MSNTFDIRHIASLARIRLTEEEEKKMSHELTSILAFVEKLEEPDTANTPPMTGGTNLENVMRSDAPTEEVPNRDDSASLIASAPRKRGSYVEVKSVFERQ